MGLMNKLDLDYQNLLKDILENGVKKETRNGDTISVFGRQIRHKMSEGFPLLTTKKMPFKTIVTELLWFLRGDTNIKFLVDNDCHIWDGDCYKNYLRNCLDIKWMKENFFLDGSSNHHLYTQEEFINKIKTDDEFAKKWGELGPIYGKQWRSWEGVEIKYDEFGENHYEVKTKHIDQIQNLINDLKTNPDSRRLMVNAWNVGELDQMVLPPCHYGFQVYTRELSEGERLWICSQKHHIRFGTNDGPTWYNPDNPDRDKLKWMTEDQRQLCDSKNIPTRAISLMWNQRSVDTFLGLPFNIASYGLLLEIIAKEVNMVPDELIGNLGDVHLYSNHIEQAKEQIGRELTHDEKVEYARSLYGNEEWWDINDKRVITVLQRKKQTREPYPLPTLKELPNYRCMEPNWRCYEIDDIQIENYKSHPTIKAPLSN